MKQIKVTQFLVALTVISLIGIGTTAYAGWGRGHYGPMMQGRGWSANPYGSSNLSEEDIKKLEESNEAFFKETEGLRRQIAAKELELRSELIKENPDPKIASAIQKELSDLESQFDQKRLERRLEMQKIKPYAGSRYMGRGGWGRGNMGPGHMGGGYMGGGPGGGYGAGNCPWQ